MGGDQRHSIDGEVEWISRLGERFRIPLTFLAMVNEQDPHRRRHWFSAVRTANAAGANVRPQVASRAFGMLMGHQSRMNPFRHRRSYRALMDLPLDQRVRALRDPQMKARILAETPDAGDAPSADQLNRHMFKRLTRSESGSTTNRRLTTASRPSQRASVAIRGRSPTTLCCTPKAKSFCCSRC